GLDRIDDLGQRLAALTVGEGGAGLAAVEADGQRRRRQPRRATEPERRRQVLVEGDVGGLPAHAAAGQDRGRGVVAVRGGQQVDPLDDEDLVLVALAVGVRIVERRQRAVLV